MRFTKIMVASSLLMASPAFAGLKIGTEPFLTGAQVKQIVKLAYSRNPVRTFQDPDSQRTFEVTVPFATNAESVLGLLSASGRVDDENVFPLLASPKETTYFLRIQSKGTSYPDACRPFASYQDILVLVEVTEGAGEDAGAAVEQKSSGTEEKKSMSTEEKA
jgi:hypothetical protein